MFDHSLSTCTFSLSLSLFFGEVQISSCTLIPLFNQDETTVTECFLTNCVLARFLTDPTLCLDSRMVSPLGLHWVKGVCVFRCNLPPALLAE